MLQTIQGMFAPPGQLINLLTAVTRDDPIAIVLARAGLRRLPKWTPPASASLYRHGR